MTLRWVRLFWLLAALGGAGILVIHNQTTVVTTGYRISEKIEHRGKSRERNRMLRIEMGRAGVPEQVRESWKALTESEEKKADDPASAPE